MQVSKESEKRLEARLRTEVKKLGGWCIKLLSTFSTGLPDRLVLMPGGRIYFVELKSEGLKPSPIQLYVHTQLRNLGFKVYVIDCTKLLNEFLDEIRTA